MRKRHILGNFWPRWGERVTYGYFEDDRRPSKRARVSRRSHHESRKVVSNRTSAPGPAPGMEQSSRCQRAAGPDRAERRRQRGRCRGAEDLDHVTWPTPRYGPIAARPACWGAGAPLRHWKRLDYGCAVRRWNVGRDTSGVYCHPVLNTNCPVRDPKK